MSGKVYDGMDEQKHFVNNDREKFFKNGKFPSADVVIAYLTI